MIAKEVVVQIVLGGACCSWLAFCLGWAACVLLRRD
jgi:hypothetical protein